MLLHPIALETLVDTLVPKIIENTSTEIQNEEKFKNELLELFANQKLRTGYLDYALMLYMEKELKSVEMTYQGEKYPFEYTNPFEMEIEDYELYVTDILQDLVSDLEYVRAKY